MTARIISLFFTGPRIMIVGIAASLLLFAACSNEVPGVIGEPNPVTETTVPKGSALNLWNNKTGTPGPLPTRGYHLLSCEDDSTCGGGTTCVNLFGEGGFCFYKCDPDKGTGDTQNPNCIEPENCIGLNDGSGICVALPGQLYGIGSYKAVVNHKQGKPCLLRYGGCESGLICVDTDKQGSIGTCQEYCIPDKSTCQTAGTTCQQLYSGYGACLK